MKSNTNNRELASGILLGGLDSTSISLPEKNFYSNYPLSGITLFKRNIPDSICNLPILLNNFQHLRPSSSPPFIIAIDQEGGRVKRLTSPFPDIGPNLPAFAAGPTKENLCLSENYGYYSGISLKALGVNVNFAPVLDVFTEKTDSSIGDRCFSSDPKAVAKLAKNYIIGLDRSNVKSCLKHFPGQGAGESDTHEEHALINSNLELLHSRELVPFKSLVEFTQMVMISHAKYLHLDLENGAFCSKKIIQNLLQKELKFKGIVVSDDLNMKAFDSSQEDYESNLAKSLEAGVNLLLVCQGLEKIKNTVHIIENLCKNSSDIKNHVLNSFQKIQHFRKSLNNSA